ncbi:hypothetical protein MTR67_026191 [Solanum verrucosum]|uniref:Uncharacterized protein n=1 Tax=Solanum verrucosum TaxID=315347 RepID=A0AAF0R024_SOLVR|nr:hypothetical protein MTR67_026191 [Solanum verrucosum]
MVLWYVVMLLRLVLVVS